MQKILSTMVAAVTLCLASQASAVTVKFSAGTNVATGISGITYSAMASFGSGGFGNGYTTGYAQGNTKGLGVNATPNPGRKKSSPDVLFRNQIDTRVYSGSGAPTETSPSVEGAWEMLTITFSEAVNLTSFILGLMDEDDDFEYSFNGSAFTSVGPAMAEIPADFVLTQSTKTYTMAAWNPVTTFSIRATGVGANDNDDFSLGAAKISVVPLPAGVPLLLAGLASLAALRHRKKKVA